MALRLRRGTNAERTAITPEAGELVFTTDTKKVFVGDGTTTGGIIVSGQNDIVDDGTPQLGGDLDLNGNNITGTGNINITGTITATGNINLGDGAGGDVLSIGGVLSGNLIADAANAYTIGSSAVRYAGGFFNALTVTGHMTADSIQADLIGNDSTVMVNVENNIFTGALAGNVTGNVLGNVTGTLTGEVTGSVFADDSTVMVDGISNTLTSNKGTITSLNSSTLIVSEGTAAGQGILTVRRTQKSVADLSLIPQPMGNILFDYEDATGISEPKAVISGGNNYLRFTAAAEGVITGVTPASNTMTWYDSKLVVGARTAYSTEKLQVQGSARIDGYADIEQIRIEGNGIKAVDSNANLELSASGTGTIKLNVPVQTTVGAAGAAAAVPATPSTYFKINVGGTEYVVPAFAVS
jgi:hypothetical protein